MNERRLYRQYYIYLIYKTMESKLKIVPFINPKGEQRFKVVGSQGNIFLDAFGHGYYSPQTAHNGISLFAKSKKIKNIKNIKYMLVNELLKKYEYQLELFNSTKSDLESQLEGNDVALEMGNLYYMSLMEIVKDLKDITIPTVRQPLLSVDITDFVELLKMVFSISNVATKTDMLKTNDDNHYNIQRQEKLLKLIQKYSNA